jgi:hypothetical protein
VDGGAAWTWCKGGAFPHGALARIDASAGEGRVRWPLPAELPLGDATAGVFPGPDGALGIVLRVGSANGSLALAVAGPDGWVHPPTALPGTVMSQLLGGAWLGPTLEVVVLPTADGSWDALGNAVPTFVRAEAGTLDVRRPFADAAAVCRGLTHCYGLVWGAQFRDGVWYLVVSGERDSSGVLVWWVDEGGGVHETGWDSDVAAFVTAHVDFVESGLTETPAIDVQVLQSDGSLRTMAAPPRPEWEGDAAWKDLEIVDGRLRRRSSWVRHGQVFRRAQQVGDRILVTHSIWDLDPPILSITELTADDHETTTPVAHDPGYECGASLSMGTIIALPTGGYALVSDTGCYVLLDAALRRLDPLPLSEHLRRRGSLGRWDESSHALKLGWVLAGLPVCLGLGVLLGIVRRRRRPTSLANAAAIGAGIYVVTGGVCLAMVLPLLG